MVTWIFKAVSRDSCGNMRFVELSSEQRTRIDTYAEALEVGMRSKTAHPPFSNYFVKEGIGVRGSAIIPAGNIEYGLCQALHGEEAAIAAFRAWYGRAEERKPLVLGIVAGSSGNIASPCGNCRDIMREDLGEDFEIVSGAPEGGIAVVASMRQYLFEDFRMSSCTAIDTIKNGILEKVILAIYEGERMTNDAYSPPDLYSERKYSALIETRRNNFIGARDIMCEYHPIYALRDAVRQARRAHDPFVERVFIVCEWIDGKLPHVMYKDRQHLFELNLQAELASGNEQDPPVYLVAHKRGEVVRMRETSVKEWLPLAFSPRAFGPEFTKYLTEYYRSKSSV